MEMNALNPTLFDKLQSRIAVQSAPLWLMNPILPGKRQRLGEGRVQTDVRQHHANAVRPDDSHPAALRENLFFQFRASRSAFLETGGNDDRAFHVRGRAFGHNSRHRRRRRSDDGKIDIFRHVADFRKRFLSENR